MIESIKAVNNPLTIIAIFSALAEVAGTVAIKLVAPELQHTFIWFVMGFPVLIVLAFFFTLNFNPKVLYAPSDFKDETNFVNVLSGVKQEVSLNLEEVNVQLEKAKERILNDITQQAGKIGEKERQNLETVVNKQLATVQSSLDSTIEKVEDVPLYTHYFRWSDTPKFRDLFRTPLTDDDKAILRLVMEKGSATLQELVDGVNLPPTTVEKRIQRLIKNNFVEKRDDKYHFAEALQSLYDRVTQYYCNHNFSK